MQRIEINQMRRISILIVVVGLLITVYTSINLMTPDKVVDIGDLEISNVKNYALDWLPVLGIVMIVTGGVMYVSDSKKNK